LFVFPTSKGHQDQYGAHNEVFVKLLEEMVRFFSERLYLSIVNDYTVVEEHRDHQLECRPIGQVQKCSNREEHACGRDCRFQQNPFGHILRVQVLIDVLILVFEALFVQIVFVFSEEEEDPNWEGGNDTKHSYH